MKELVDGALEFSSSLLCLSPFAFDGVEIGGVGGEKFESMPRIVDHFLDVGAFVECRVVHDNDGLVRQLGEQVLFNPGVKNLGIDVGVEQSHGQQQLPDQGTDGICPLSRLPVMGAKTTFSDGRIAVGAGHVVSKAALVDINDGAGFCLIDLDLLLEDMPCGDVRLWMHQGFF